MGTFAGKTYTEEDGETALTVNSLTSKDLKLTANANKTQYKLENLELKQGDEFVIRVNEAIAGLAKYDRSALKRVDLDGVTRPAEANENIELFMASESNIMARCDMTVDVTLYTIGGMQIGIVVKELDASEGLKKDALKIELVGKIGVQDSWNG